MLGGEGGPLVAVNHMEEEGILEGVVHLSKDLGFSWNPWYLILTITLLLLPLQWEIVTLSHLQSLYQNMVSMIGRFLLG